MKPLRLCREIMCRVHMLCEHANDHLCTIFSTMATSLGSSCMVNDSNGSLAMGSVSGIQVLAAWRSVHTVANMCTSCLWLSCPILPALWHHAPPPWPSAQSTGPGSVLHRQGAYTAYMGPGFRLIDLPPSHPCTHCTGFPPAHAPTRVCTYSAGSSMSKSLPADRA